VKWLLITQASYLAVAHTSHTGKHPSGEAALRMSEIELMVDVLRVWSVEERRVTGVPVLF